MESIKEKFKEFSRPEFFSRVDNNHILELYIGLDKRGQKSIELRSDFTPIKVTGTSSIEVNQYSKQEYRTIRFSLKNDDMSGLFYKFCEDIIEESRGLTDKEDGYKTVTGRFFQWKKMFVMAKKQFLTEPEIMGLIGELLFLKNDLSKRLGLSNALKSWSGQELTHKDFSFNDTWAEIKSVSRGSRTVRISSLEQLSSNNSGELVVFLLEKMSPSYQGITLNKLVLETKDLFKSQDERDDFLSKVALQGYEYHNYYDDFVFEVSGIVKYCVDDTFPKLTLAHVPQAVAKASYDLLMTELNSYMIKE